MWRTIKTMSNMRDINSENYNAKRQTIILRKITHPGLLKVNRYLVWIFISLMAAVVLLGFLLFPTNSLLRSYEANQMSGQVYGNVPMNPAVSAEINTLKGQLVGLISGSIESRLRTLEVSIRSGNVSPSDLGTIQDLKNDVKVLKTYSETGAGRLIAKPYAVDKKEVYVTNHQLIKEVSQLKDLIYFSIASCGLMFAAVGGIWLQGRHRLGMDQNSGSEAGKKFLNK